MTLHSSDQFWFQKGFEFHCGECGCDSGFRSRRRTFSERYLLPVFLLQPVRCAECFRRGYRFIFVPVRERLSDVIGEQAAAVPGRDTRNVA